MAGIFLWVCQRRQWEANGRGWELWEWLNSQPGLSQLLGKGPLLSPDALSSQSPNHGSVPSPEPLSLHVHLFSLAKQTGGETKTDRLMDRELYFGL